MPQVQIIEPTIRPQKQKIRVCAYARVSSNSDDQLNSFSAQVEYFTQLIQAHSDWEFIDIYADEGITGTRADKRDDFQRMMRDCRAGRIDRILVKSISRFGRNSADCIEAVRELKILGIAVAFEKEGIDTGRMTNEMYFSMYSAFSQEESTSIAKNMRKGAVMRMKNGTYPSIPSALWLLLR
jgi:site-specific DNA recombinase